MNPNAILDATATAFGVDRATLIGATHSRYATLARHAAAYALRLRIPALSLVEIGELLGGRHHTTIMAALTNVEARIVTDTWYRAQVQQLLATEVMSADS